MNILNSSSLDMIAFLIQDFVLIFIIYFCVVKLLKSKNGYLPAFFTFSMISYLLSGLYWVAEIDRMPFAVDEIADSAAILLLSTGLVADKKVDRTARAGELIFTVMFSLSNVALWICWSGEWLQDIIFGIPYSYFLWLIIRGIADTKPLTSKTVTTLRINSVTIVFLSFLIIILPGSISSVLDVICYILMFGMLIWLLIKSIQSKNLYVSALYFFTTIFVSYGCA